MGDWVEERRGVVRGLKKETHEANKIGRAHV